MKTQLSQLKTASIFGAFTTPLKLAIINALLPGPVNVVGITKATGIQQPIASQILKQFRGLGIVSPNKQGRITLYQLSQPEAMRQLLDLAESLAA